MGDLQYVALSPDDGLQGNALVATSRDQQITMSGPTKVATYNVGTGVVKVAVVQGGSPKVPAALVVDLTGEGKFQGISPVNIRQMPSSNGETVGISQPATLTLSREGKKIPVYAAAEYTRSLVNSETIELTLGMAAKGECQFGSKTYKVRVLDTSQNLQLGDAPSKGTGGKDGPAANFGDTVVVETSKGLVKGYCGQPVYLDGAWFDVTVDGAAMKISAKPAEVQGGFVKVAHDSWSAVLVGKKYVADATGGRDKVPVPADDYVIAAYTERAGPGTGAQQAHFSCFPSKSRETSSAAAIKVTANETTEIKNRVTA